MDDVEEQDQQDLVNNSSDDDSADNTDSNTDSGVDSSIPSDESPPPKKKVIQRM